MVKITKLILLFCCGFLFAQKNVEAKRLFGKVINPSNITSTGHIRCATNEYMSWLRENNPNVETDEQFENWIAKKIEQEKNNQQVQSQIGNVIYVPVVVHVIHDGDAYGTNENISDEQVQSQITVLTQDFRRMMNTPGFNDNPVGADIEIEFVLAKVDPNGNPTNGINRVNMCQASWADTDINQTVKPTTIWDPTQYMNMWSVNFTDAQLLGYAQFPSTSSLSGLNSNGGFANTDGVVAGYRFFGSSDLAAGTFFAPIDKGRTMTHEVGHYLGLRHIWGDGGCSVDDFCNDTPVAGDFNEGCPVGTDSCPSNSGVDMIENYMDYTYDACMNIFTNDQKTRMRTVMNNSPRRSTLKTSAKDMAIPLFANDAEVIIENYCGPKPTCSNLNVVGTDKVVLLYNRGTSNLTSATLTYNINNGTSNTFNWSGNLATDRYAVITLSNTTSNATLNVTVTNVNGVADQRASNNTKSKSFFVDNINGFTNYNFTLIGDRYGTETTWNLTNAAGTVLYSGGPYSNLSTNTTQTLENNIPFTLPVSGCYTLTVNDSFSDGICCGSGVGSFSLTANNGAVSVINGSLYGATTSKSFTNNVLSNDDFELLSNVYLFPNPSKNIISIVLPDNIDTSSSNVSIYNSLGQNVLSKGFKNSIELKIDISSLSIGVYHVNLNTNGATKLIKFIKE